MAISNHTLYVWTGPVMGWFLPLEAHLTTASVSSAAGHPNNNFSIRTRMLGDQDTCEGAIHISPTEINATVMHTIQRNRGLAQPANR